MQSERSGAAVTEIMMLLRVKYSVQVIFNQSQVVCGRISLVTGEKDGCLTMNPNWKRCLEASRKYFFFFHLKTDIR